MAETTAAGTRCPRCSAALRPGAPWCTQCYAPTGAATDVPTGALPDGPSPSPPAPDHRVQSPVGTAVADRTASTGLWPCSACDEVNDLVLSTCEGCGTPFLAPARGARPTVVLPVVGDLLELSPVRRVALAAGAVLAFVVVATLLALLLA